jgi:hypothetical protein
MNNHGRVEHKREVLSAKSFVRKPLLVYADVIPIAINKQNIKSQKIATLQPNGSFGGGNSTKVRFHKTYTLVLIRKNEKDNFRGYRRIDYTFNKPQISGKIFNIYGKQWRIQ